LPYNIEEYCINGILLLDGGMGQELVRSSQTPHTNLWAAQALLDQPKRVQELHEKYIRAGAKVITTNSYTTVRHRLQTDAGLGNRFTELNSLAGELAVKARESTNIPVLIAGSLPPLFGSYRPDKVRSIEEIEPIYQEHVEVLNPYVDLFLGETLSKSEEGIAVASAVSKTNKPVWISWTIEDEGSTRLRGGETLHEACGALERFSVEAILVNCCTPESITAAIPELLNTNISARVGGYANGFEQIPNKWTISDGIDALGQRHDLDPEQYAAHVQNWINLGARIVGGCCETGPAHIQKISDLIQTSF